MAAIPLAVIIGVVALVHSPSLQRLPADDHWYYLIDTVNYRTFGELVSHTYSWPRTRQVAPGDAGIFRPIFFTVLAVEKSLIGYRVELWQVPGFVLHILLTYLLYLYGKSWPFPDACTDPETASTGRIGRFRGPLLKICALSVALFFAANPMVCEQVAWSHINPYQITLALLCGSAFLLRKLIAATPARKGTRDGIQFLGVWILLALAAFNSELGILAPFAVCIVIAIAPVTGRFPIRRKILWLFMFLMIPVIFEATNLLDARAHGAAASGLDPEAALRAERAFSRLSASNSWMFLEYSIGFAFLAAGTIVGWTGIAVALALIVAGLLPKHGQSWKSWYAAPLYPLLLWLAYGALTVYARLNPGGGFRGYYGYSSLFLLLLSALPLLTRGLGVLFSRTQLRHVGLAGLVTAVVAGTFLVMAAMEAPQAYRECVRWRDTPPMRAVFNQSAPAPVLRNYVKTVRTFIAEHCNEPDFSMAQDIEFPSILNPSFA
jgi:hypothetical protein